MTGFTDNSQTVLHDYAEAQRLSRYPELTFNEFWEYFVAGLVTKSFDLNDEELDAGVVGSGGDGGIDFIYVFIDEMLVHSDTEVDNLKRSPAVHLVVGQAKNTTKFSEDVINRLIAVTSSLLNLNATFDTLSDVYNQDVREAFSLFRHKYREILPKVPSLKISYYYGANRAPNEISGGLTARVEELRAVAAKKFVNADVSVTLLGAAELWALASERSKDVANLKLERWGPGRKGYICLVALDQLDAFLRPDSGALNQTLFDSNVRHYLKATPVNQNISETLANPSDIDFWWLNNGVTILGSNLSLNDDILTISDPQIVNGLQTSLEVARHFEAGGNKPDTRTLLVKAISVESDEIRDSIIRATNNQNPVSKAMLRATEGFQRTLEAFLSTRGLFYDRRKGYWSAQGKPQSQIVSLTYVAQAIMSVVLFRPDDARARPSDSIGDDDKYKTIFSEETPLGAYLVCAKLARGASLFLRKEAELSKGQVSNLRFYVAMVTGWYATKTATPSAAQISEIDPDDAIATLVSPAYELVKKVYDALGATDEIAKGPKLKNELLDAFSNAPAMLALSPKAGLEI